MPWTYWIGRLHLAAHHAFETCESRPHHGRSQMSEICMPLTSPESSTGPRLPTPMTSQALHAMQCCCWPRQAANRLCPTNHRIAVGVHVESNCWILSLRIIDVLQCSFAGCQRGLLAMPDQGISFACRRVQFKVGLQLAGRTWLVWTDGLPQWTLPPCVLAASGPCLPHRLENHFHR